MTSLQEFFSRKATKDKRRKKWNEKLLEKCNDRKLKIFTRAGACVPWIDGKWFFESLEKWNFKRSRMLLIESEQKEIK